MIIILFPFHSNTKQLAAEELLMTLGDLSSARVNPHLHLPE